MKLTFIIDDITDKEADDIADEIIYDLHTAGIMISDYRIEESGPSDR